LMFSNMLMISFSISLDRLFIITRISCFLYLILL
jgi:hypothetical protein